MKKVLMGVALALWLSAAAGAQSAAPTPEDNTMQVYYHRQYYEAAWRSERIPGQLVRQSGVMLCIVGGLLALRKASGRSRLT